MVHDFFRLTMTEEHFSIGKHDANAGVAPNVGAAFSDAANAITAHWTPGRDGVGLDVLQRNGAQTEAESADLDSVAGEAIMKTAPGQCGRSQQKHHGQAHDPAQAV